MIGCVIAKTEHFGEEWKAPDRGDKVSNSKRAHRERGMPVNVDSVWKFGKVIIEKLTLGEHTVDIEGFLLASGFALLVVLVGWANQITSRSKEAKDLEMDFLKKAKLKREDYKKIINEGGSTEDSFSALVNFLYSKKEEDVEIFEKIKEIKSDFEKLDRKYCFRFWLLLWMSISFFVTGILAFFLPSQYEILSLFPNLIFIFLTFVNLIRIFNLEKRYTKSIQEAMEKL